MIGIYVYISFTLGVFLATCVETKDCTGLARHGDRAFALIAPVLLVSFGLMMLINHCLKRTQ